MSSENHPSRWTGGKRSVKANDPEPSGPDAPTPEAPTPETPEPTPDPQTQIEEPTPEPLVTDAARQFAAENGIDLATVTGTGAEGRITKDDVAALVPAPSE